MLQNTAAKRYTYSLKSASDFKCKIVENSVYGLQLDIDGTDFHSLLIGEFNAYNLTLVYGAAILLGCREIGMFNRVERVDATRRSFPTSDFTEE